mmetsp:Transcript_9916/g.11277  ORF Transcript_9916/g.11277 Transcript_9916/m.11277 type:complete len:240 (-) Transcript_9916:1020-1739(-)
MGSNLVTLRIKHLDLRSEVIVMMQSHLGARQNQKQKLPVCSGASPSQKLKLLSSLVRHRIQQQQLHLRRHLHRLSSERHQIQPHLYQTPTPLVLLLLLLATLSVTIPMRIPALLSVEEAIHHQAILGQPLVAPQLGALVATSNLPSNQAVHHLVVERLGQVATIAAVLECLAINHWVRPRIHHLVKYSLIIIVLVIIMVLVKYNSNLLATRLLDSHNLRIVHPLDNRNNLQIVHPLAAA